MANQKISQLTDGSPVQSGDQFVINRSGANFRVSSVTSGLLQASVTLSPTQIQAMANSVATSVTVVSAPGAGLVVFPLITYVWMPYGGTPYATGTGALDFYYNTGSLVQDTLNVAGLTSANIKATTFVSRSALQVQGAGGTTGNWSNSAIANVPYVVNIANATQYTAGNSSINILMYYNVLPTT